MNSVFDRLRKSKWAYVASGWTTFLDNLAKPGNESIAEVIKNDRDFFAHNEAVQSAKDVGKLRQAIKAAIGRAGAVAYMERTRAQNGNGQPEWRWQDFTSRVIDAGLQIPKEERHMWILNCGKLKKGEKIKLPGTKDEYEVLEIQAGEAKIFPSGTPLGSRISDQAEVLVWRPGAQFAEKIVESKPAVRIMPPVVVRSETGVRTISHEELEAMKAKKAKLENVSRKEETEMVKPNRTSASATKNTSQITKKSRPVVEPEPEPQPAENRWRKNSGDGEVPFRFGMPVRRGKMTGKVIRTHGSKMRVRLDNDEGAVDWSTEDETIFWKDPIDVQDEDENDDGPEPHQVKPVVKAKAKEEKSKGKAKGKPEPEPEPEPFDDEEEEIEIEEDDDDEDEVIGEDDDEDDSDDEDDDDEIDPDDLPDDDADLLDADSEDDDQEEGEEDEEGEDDSDEDQDEDDSDNPDDGGEGEVEGDDDKEYTYNGNDIAELAGVDYQRVQRLKAQGVLDGTWLAASNGRIMYTFDAVEMVKNAPRNKPGRPPGGGRKRDKQEEKASGVSISTGKPRQTTPAAKPDPRQRTIPIMPKDALPVRTSSKQKPPLAPTYEKGSEDETVIEKETSTGPRTTAQDIFIYTINEIVIQTAKLKNEIATREAELEELEKAMETLEGIVRRNR